MITHAPFIQCTDVIKSYPVANHEVRVLQGFNLEVKQAEMVALVGAAGSGKSTLLHILAGLETVTGGSVFVGGVNLLTLSAEGQLAYRRTGVGMVWQQSSRQLLPFLTIKENIEQRLRLNTNQVSGGKQWVDFLLEKLTLLPFADQPINQLSLEVQHRVSLATALANHPPLLLVDAPPFHFYPFLRQINQQFKTTILLSSSMPLVSDQVDRIVGIGNGRSSLNHQHPDQPNCLPN